MVKPFDVTGCRLKFEIVEYAAHPGKQNYRAVIFDRPYNRPNLIIQRDDWDVLLFDMDFYFNNYNIKYPVPIIKYDMDYKLIV